MPGSIKTKQYLIENNIPEDFIITETKSLDTLSNFVFTKPILDKILTKGSTVGIITDKYHIDRSMWTAKKVLGKDYIIKPFPTNKSSIIRTLTGSVIKEALFFDLMLIKPDKYIEEKHPYFVKNPPFTFYKLGMKIEEFDDKIFNII